MAKRKGPGLFVPIVLISLGVIFLLSNLGIIGSLDWGAALRLWPLALVFAGLGVIAQQLTRPWGGCLSALVGLLAVVVFGGVLLFGQQITWVQSWGGGDSAELQTLDVNVSADGVDSAEIRIDFDAPGAYLSSALDSDSLLEGTITYQDEVDLRSDVEDGSAEVSLATQDSGWGWLNPATWDEVEPWDLRLNSRIPTALQLDVGSGSVEFDLIGLTLTNLEIDGGSGVMHASLPAGQYETEFDGASGASQLILPTSGEHTIEIDGGSGAMVLQLPPRIGARFEIDAGSGAVSVRSSRLNSLSASSGDERVWQSDNYDPTSGNSLLVIIDGGSGAIAIEDWGGR